MDIIEYVVYRRAYGPASDLAEARSHRLAGRLHDAPGAGGMLPRPWPRSGAGSTSPRGGPPWSVRPSRRRSRGDGRGGDADTTRGRNDPRRLHRK